MKTLLTSKDNSRNVNLIRSICVCISPIYLLRNSPYPRYSGWQRYTEINYVAEEQREQSTEQFQILIKTQTSKICLLPVTAVMATFHFRYALEKPACYLLLLPMVIQEFQHTHRKSACYLLLWSWQSLVFVPAASFACCWYQGVNCVQSCG